MGIADGRAANIQTPRGGLYLCLGLDQALLKCQCDHEGLHGGARLKAVGQGAVAQLLAAEVLPPRGRIAWVIGQRQHLAALHIEHHHAARLGFILQHRLTQFLISKELHLAVNTELDVAPVHWRNILAHRLHHPATAVLDDPARTSASGQVLVESQLNALLPAIINIGEAHHMGSGFALRVQALVFLALVNAPDAQRPNFLGQGHIDLSFERYKTLFLIGQKAFKLDHGHIEQRGELLQANRVAVNVFGHRPDAGHGHAGGQNQAIAVEHPATTGGELQGTGKTHLALALKEIVVDHLDVDRARAQQAKRECNHAHHQLAAPNRRTAGEQRAGVVVDAAAHGRSPPETVLAAVAAALAAGCAPEAT